MQVTSPQLLPRKGGGKPPGPPLTEGRERKKEAVGVAKADQTLGELRYCKAQGTINTG